tara:strand:- start:234 stop:977 length:744 start_codon:yes stop_codon:yes gene_type:complete
MTASKSAVIYRGPSLIDGHPIAVIAVVSDRNRKTGLVVQTYILLDDIDPRDASKSGADYSICGACPMRGEATTDPKRKQAKSRRCYVKLYQGVLITWRHYKAGGYRTAIGHGAIAAIGAERVVRIGTYGDPSAVPSYVWDSLLADSIAHMAYSHQSGMPGVDFRPDLYMVSADTEAQARAAWDAGQRTFRVVSSVEDIVKGREILCPASKEAGARVQCTTCRLCGGASVKAKSIAIPDHGPMARRKA